MPRTIRCPAGAGASFDLAHRFLKAHAAALADAMEFHPRRGKNRRIRRRLSNKIDKLVVVCRPSGAPLCKNHTGRGIPIVGRRIKICYATMKSENKRLSDLVELMAHEVAHKAGVPFAWTNHSRSNPNDKVYRFGQIAKSLFLAESTSDPGLT